VHGLHVPRLFLLLGAMKQVGLLCGRPRALFLCACLSTAAAVHAQRTDSPTQPRHSESLEVEIINVDVRVHDNKGRAVVDLQLSECVLFVNGRQTEITNFAPLSPQLAVSADPPWSTLAPETPASQETSQALSAWLIHVDMLRLSRTARAQVLRQVKRFLRQSVRESEPVLISTFDGDRFKVLQPLGRASDAIAALTVLERPAVAARGFLPSLLGSDSTGDVEEAERRVKASLRALRTLSELAAGAAGRTVLLLVGGGYKFSRFPPLRSAELNSEYQRLIDRLSENRVTVYTIFAGPERFVGWGADEAPDVSQNYEPPPRAGDVEPSSEIAAYADETGGRAFVSSPNLSDQMTSVRGEMDFYYSLGFRAPARASTQRLEIEIRVLRSGVRVRHRRGIRVRSDFENAEAGNVMALFSEPPNRWPIDVTASRPRRHGRGYQIEVQVKVPVEAIVIRREPEGNVGQLRFHVATRDGKGNFSQFETRELAIHCSDEEMMTLRQKGIRFTVTIGVAPGPTEIAVTTWDVMGRSGATARTRVTAGRMGSGSVSR
jgi:VWFA-related protein